MEPNLIEYEKVNERHLPLIPVWKIKLHIEKTYMEQLSTKHPPLSPAIEKVRSTTNPFIATQKTTPPGDRRRNSGTYWQNATQSKIVERIRQSTGVGRKGYIRKWKT